MKKPRPVFDRFSEKYSPDPNTGCWLWVAGVNHAGYGTIGIGRRPKVRSRLAHRVSYELFKGPIPNGLCVCHHCDTPACVNPEHLFLGTHQDNADDKVRKGRCPRGDDAARVSIRTADLEVIKDAVAKGVKRTAIAAAWGVTITAIGYVVTGRRRAWCDLQAGTSTGLDVNGDAVKP